MHSKPADSVKARNRKGMSNIILIGMPGSGKSTVGVVLAKKLGRKFIDSDLVIQERSGKLLYQLIEEKGEEGFIALEEEINASLDPENAVIATGGSAVYGKEAMGHFKEIGKLVYLKLPFDELENRLGDLHERGVVLKEGYSLGDLFCERTPLYEKYADLVIDCAGLCIRGVVEAIVREVKNVPG